MFFFFKQETAYEMRISDWSSDVCSSDLTDGGDTDALRLQFFGERFGKALQTRLGGLVKGEHHKRHGDGFTADVDDLSTRFHHRDRGAAAIDRAVEDRKSVV